MVAINNRDLTTFKVDIGRSAALIKLIPTDKIRIAESGIKSIETINSLKAVGFNGFLMGEVFMREADPGKAFADFIEKLKHQDEY